MYVILEKGVLVISYLLDSPVTFCDCTDSALQPLHFFPLHSSILGHSAVQGRMVYSSDMPSFYEI